MDKAKLQAALIAGPLFGVLANVPVVSYVNTACCALYVGGGLLAGYLFFKGRAPLDNPYGEGALTGLLAGVFGGIVDGVLDLALRLLGVGANQAAEALATVEEQGIAVPASVLSLLGLGPATPATAVLGIVLATVLYSIFGTVGGLLGAAFFRNKAGDG